MVMERRLFLKLCALSSLGNKLMGSGWENPGPAKRVIITGTNGELLVYNGPPAAGNLIIAISGTAGSDSFGNAYNAGVTFPWRTTNTFNPLTWNDSLGNPVASINVQDAFPPIFDLKIIADRSVENSPNPNKAKIHLQGGLIGGPAAGGGLQFNSGPPGGYCTGNLTWSASRATNTLTSLASAAFNLVKSNNDYGSSPAVTSDFINGSGQFIPPVDSYYDIYMFMGAATGATREACIIRKNGVEIEHSEAPNATNMSAKLISEWLVTTDVIDFEPFFVSATTPQTLSGRINISRRL